MRFNLLTNDGSQFAIFGAMLSKGKMDYDKLVESSKTKLSQELLERGWALQEKLAPMDGGHNKFLEQIQYWIVIQAPLYWWKQFDTYRIGVSKSSESTMFKMWKNGITRKNFEKPEMIYQETIDNLNNDIKEYNETQNPVIFKRITNNLPDGYLQTRIVNINAKSLRNIYFQRRNHKLTEWHEFCDFIKLLPAGKLITAETV